MPNLRVMMLLPWILTLAAALPLAVQTAPDEEVPDWVLPVQEDEAQASAVPS